MANNKSAARESISSPFSSHKAVNHLLWELLNLRAAQVWELNKGLSPTLTFVSRRGHSQVCCAIHPCCMRCSRSLAQGCLFHTKFYQYIFYPVNNPLIFQHETWKWWYARPSGTRHIVSKNKSRCIACATVSGTCLHMCNVCCFGQRNYDAELSLLRGRRHVFFFMEKPR